MRRVLLVTPHYLGSKRRAGFHFLADAFWRAGWQAVQFTVSLSPLSRMVHDHRLAYPVRAEANRLVWLKERLGSFVWWTPWHPAHLRLGVLNRLSAPLFRRYGMLPLGEAEALVREADLFIFESASGLLLAERFADLNPRAKRIYRVSDDLRRMRNHPVIREAEDRLVGRFHLVSIPSEAILRRFSELPTARLHYHGLDKPLFDREHADPFDRRWKVQSVFIGNSHLDRDFISRAAARFPAWAFHVLGPFDSLTSQRNVIAHGEQPFEATLPYLKHADIGLHTVSDCPQTRASTDSLKVIQYTYCRLPIIAPEFLRTGRPHVFYYQPGDDASIGSALESARAFDRTTIGTDDIQTWDELARTLCHDAGITD